MFDRKDKRIMNKKPRKKMKLFTKLTIVVLIIGIILPSTLLYKCMEVIGVKVDNLVERVETREEQEELNKQNEIDNAIKQGIGQDYTTKLVRATYYHTGDGTGSTDTTASGLSTDNFKINDMGWYVYKGKVVVATAMNYCVISRRGICNAWNYKHPETAYFDLYDTLFITVKGVTYEAIALDLCGSASAGENKIDIFVSEAKYGYDGPMIITYLEVTDE